MHGGARARGAESHACAQVLRDFCAPEGTAPGDLDAGGDGEVLAVLDLRTDNSLQARAAA